jgi:hypothetical protein
LSRFSPLLDRFPPDKIMHIASEDAEVEEELSRFVHRLLAP